MGRFIVKLADKYLEWSSVVDAPVTYGMTLDEFKTYYIEEYGRSSEREMEERLARVETKGTSSMIHKDVDELISYNRAGEKESLLSKEELIEKFCTGVPDDGE